jgi:hypothetical protein
MNFDRFPEEERCLHRAALAAGQVWELLTHPRSQEISENGERKLRLRL